MFQAPFLIKSFYIIIALINSVNVNSLLFLRKMIGALKERRFANKESVIF